MRITNLLPLSLVLLACGGDPGTGDPVPGPGPSIEDSGLTRAADAALDARSGSSDSGSSDSGSSATGEASVSTTCASGTTVLTAGASITFQAASSGNKQRDYCFVAPASAKEVHIDMSGGSCAPYPCMGSDVHLFLKKGDVPNAFSPDSSTKLWTYGPGTTSWALFVKGASGGGAWYLSLRDDANTLGYKSVKMSVSFL